MTGHVKSGAVALMSYIVIILALFSGCGSLRTAGIPNAAGNVTVTGQETTLPDQASQAETTQNETVQEQAAQDKAAQNEVAQKQTAQDKATQNEAAQEQTAQDKATQNEVAQEQAAQDKATQNEAAQEQTAQDKAAQNKTAQKQTAQDKATLNETSQKQASQDKAAQNETSQKQASQYRFRNKKLLTQHYEKHGIDMGYGSAAEYEAAASAVACNPDSLHKTEKEDGDDVYYLTATNEFVIVSTDGYIRTYFKPDSGIRYYNKQ